MILRCVASFLVVPVGAVLVPGLSLVGWTIVVFVIVVHAAGAAKLVECDFLLDVFASSSSFATTVCAGACTAVGVGYVS